MPADAQEKWFMDILKLQALYRHYPSERQGEKSKENAYPFSPACAHAERKDDDRQHNDSLRFGHAGRNNKHCRGAGGRDYQEAAAQKKESIYGVGLSPCCAYERCGGMKALNFIQYIRRSGSTKGS